MELQPWQVEALEVLRRHDYSGVLKVASGKGKTVLAIAVIKELMVKTLVVVPTINLMYQWRDQLQKFAPDISTSFYYGSEKDVSGMVIISVINSAVEASFPPITLKILDEIHHYGADIYTRVFDIGTAHTIGLSATPEREDEGDLAIRYGAGKIVYALNNIAELRERFSLCTIRVPFTPAEFGKYNDLQSEYYRILKISGLEPSQITSRTHDKMALRILKIWSDQALLRHSAVHKEDVIKRILATEKDQKVIIFSESIPFTELMAEKLGAIPVHSKISKKTVISRLEEFRRTPCAVLAAPRMIDEGYDVPDSTVAIVASFTKSPRQMIQRDGRILRTKEMVRRYTLVIEGVEEDKYFTLLRKTNMSEIALDGLWLRYDEGFVEDLECRDLLLQAKENDVSYDNWISKKLDIGQSMGALSSDFYASHKDAIVRLQGQNPEKWSFMQPTEKKRLVLVKTRYDDAQQRVLKESVRALHQRVILPDEFFTALMRYIEAEEFELDKDTQEYIMKLATGNPLKIEANLYRMMRRMAASLVKKD